MNGIVSQEPDLSQGVTTAKAANDQASFQLMASVLNILDQAVFVSDRSGRLLFANLQGQDLVNEQGAVPKPKFNLFEEILHFELEGILGQFQRGEQEVNLPLETPDGKSRARIRWLPEQDWLVISLERVIAEGPANEAEMRQTVQELIQEREIT
jgi:PAS domain-containing protein